MGQNGAVSPNGPRARMPAPWPTPSRRPDSTPSQARPAGEGGSSSVGATSSANRRGGGGVYRRALRREVSRLRDHQRLLAIVLLSLVFSLLAAGMIGRGEASRAIVRAYWAGVRMWINGGDPYPPERPVPAVRVRPVDAAPCSRRGRCCRGTWPGSCSARDDPAVPVDGRLGLPGGRCWPRLIIVLLAFPLGREPRHREHQPAVSR